MDEAISLYEQTLVSQRRKLGADHPDTLATQNTLAVAYRQSGRVDEAIALLEQSLAGFQTKLGAEHANTLNIQHNLAVAYLAADRTDRGIDMLERTLAVQQRQLGPNHPDTLSSQNQLARAYLDADRIDQSIALFQRTLAARKSKLGATHPDTLGTMHGLALAYARSAESQQADHLFREVLIIRKRVLGPQHRDVAVTLNDFGRHLLLQHRYAEAEPHLRDCLAVCDRCLPNNWIRFDAQSALGAALLAQMKRSEAEPLLVQGYEGLKAHQSAIPVLSRTRVSEAAERLLAFYSASGNKEQADHWRKELDTLRSPPVATTTTTH